MQPFNLRLICDFAQNFVEIYSIIVKSFSTIMTFYSQKIINRAHLGRQHNLMSLQVNFHDRENKKLPKFILSNLRAVKFYHKILSIIHFYLLIDELQSLKKKIILNTLLMLSKQIFECELGKIFFLLSQKQR